MIDLLETFKAAAKKPPAKKVPRSTAPPLPSISPIGPGGPTVLPPAGGAGAPLLKPPPARRPSAPIPRPVYGPPPSSTQVLPTPPAGPNTLEQRQNSQILDLKEQLDLARRREAEARARLDAIRRQNPAPLPVPSDPTGTLDTHRRTPGAGAAAPDDLAGPDAENMADPKWRRLDRTRNPVFYTPSGQKKKPPRGMTWEDWRDNNRPGGIPNISERDMLALEEENEQRLRMNARARTAFFNQAGHRRPAPPPWVDWDDWVSDSFGHALPLTGEGNPDWSNTGTPEQRRALADAYWNEQALAEQKKASAAQMKELQKRQREFQRQQSEMQRLFQQQQRAAGRAAGSAPPQQQPGQIPGFPPVVQPLPYEFTGPVTPRPKPGPRAPKR